VSVDFGSFVVDWTDNSDNESHFRVYRQLNGGAWAELSRPDRNQTSYTDNTVVAGANTYCYRVRAKNGMGYSNYSNVACLRYSKPAKPTNVATSVASLSRINVSWTDQSVNETAFKVYRNVNGGAYSRIATLAANTTSHADTTVSQGNTYCYRARAQNPLGYSNYSNVSCARVSKPPKPTNVQVNAPSASQVDVTWTDNSNNEDRFRVYRQAGGGAWSRIDDVAANGTAYSDTTVTGGTEYCYRVRAQNGVGYSNYSNVDCTTPGGPDLSTSRAPAGFEAQSADYVMQASGPPADKDAGGGQDDVRADDLKVVRVYKDHNAWWNENRDEASLAALGKIPGYDVFVHPMADLWLGVPADTAVVYLASATGDAGTTQIGQQNHPLAQAALEEFVLRGGTLVVGLADNDPLGGYLSPGAAGTPAHELPSECRLLLFAGAAFGPDGIPMTADDHALMRGPDGITGTEDDLNDVNAGMAYGCYVAHGNLIDGIGLPAHAHVLMAADFGGVATPVMAEYAHGAGRVIVTTVTLEYAGHRPAGVGPSRLLVNLFAYALGGR
jgi:fibronectin type 3 domain-containing protein